MRPQRGHVLAAVLLLCGHQAGEALVPVLVGVVIDEGVASGDLRTMLLWLLVLGVDLLFLSHCYRFGARRARHAERQVDRALRLRIADRVLDPRGGAEAGRLPGALASIATADTQRVAGLGFGLPLLLAQGTALLVAAVALLRISLPLGLLIVLGTPPLLLLLHLLGRPLERRSGPEQERAAQASGIAADLVTGVRVLKGIGASPAAVDRYTGTSRAALRATLRASGSQAWYQGAVLLLDGLFLALVALVGGRLALAGELSVGGLVAAVGLAQFLIGPLRAIGFVNARLAQARASSERIADVLSAPPAVGAGDREPPAHSPGALTVRGLRTGPVTGLDLEVRAGELVGVVAEPATATALLAALARETDPDEGTVELDRVPLTAYPPEQARAAVLVAAHEAALFAGTVAENVRAGGPGDPAAALVAAGADQVVASLPEGEATAVTEQGRSLSGGQRQRVALARALVADAPVLVLHDPTTAVDTVTEARIAEGLRLLRAGRTTLLLTTSPTLLAVADRVVVAEAGRVRTEGTHADLLAADADYRALVLA
ncbi:ABC transporter ATP-binding protein [Pseudonocardia yuanmonensis]|uniref:ABC transporter ATP-binding protein n=1 Tax=Pseudonocardia yuanmonensis TaxID=1095914 RepID=A0ABP8WD71_9PSEU